MEHHGVGLAYKEEDESCRRLFQQHDSRHIGIEFNAAGEPLHISNVFAPHSGRPQNERIQLFENAAEAIQQKLNHKKRILVGDWNARLQARRKRGTRDNR